MFPGKLSWARAWRCTYWVLKKPRRPHLAQVHLPSPAPSSAGMVEVSLLPAAGEKACTAVGPLLASPSPEAPALSHREEPRTCCYLCKLLPRCKCRVVIGSTRPQGDLCGGASSSCIEIMSLAVLPCSVQNRRKRPRWPLCLLAFGSGACHGSREAPGKS